MPKIPTVWAWTKSRSRRRVRKMEMERKGRGEADGGEFCDRREANMRQKRKAVWKKMHYVLKRDCREEKLLTLYIGTQFRSIRQGWPWQCLSPPKRLKIKKRKRDEDLFGVLMLF